jgi:curved DNA-binding protein CbpA
MEVDYYVILQVNADASPEEVHRAYRALALRYHPDRNGSPEASCMMVRINEAYSVLGDPVRRRRYDKEQRLSCTSNVALPILAAARQAVLSHRWTVLHDEGSHLLLEQGSRRVRVSFVERLSNDQLRKFGRQYTGFAVILAVEVEKPINLSLQIVVIDLLHSVYYGGGFPDPAYRTLFAPFLASAPSG